MALNNGLCISGYTLIDNRGTAIMANPAFHHDAVPDVFKVDGCGAPYHFNFPSKRKFLKNSQLVKPGTSFVGDNIRGEILSVLCVSEAEIFQALGIAVICS